MERQKRSQHDDDPNTLCGNGISRGVAKARIKVLKNPREKTMEKGDVFVAYTTHPGWTPLFIGAEPIILEIGGMLHHGGVVAPNTPNPALPAFTTSPKKLHGGQMVEVNGTKGTVRMLK